MFRGKGDEGLASGQMALCRSRIKEVLERSVRELQQEQAANNFPEIRSSSASAGDVCTALEAVFLHSIKATLSAKVSSSIARLGKRHHTDSLSERSCWRFLVLFTPRDFVEQLSKLAYVTSEVGQCRAWVRLALNHTLMLSYVEAMLADESILRSWYSEGAFLLQKDLTRMLTRLLQGLSIYEFNLTYDSGTLNSWTRQTLQLAGLHQTSEDTAATAVSASNTHSEAKASVPLATSGAFVQHSATLDGGGKHKKRSRESGGRKQKRTVVQTSAQREDFTVSLPASLSEGHSQKPSCLPNISLGDATPLAPVMSVLDQPNGSGSKQDGGMGMSDRQLISTEVSDDKPSSPASSSPRQVDEMAPQSVLPQRMTNSSQVQTDSLSVTRLSGTSTSNEHASPVSSFSDHSYVRHGTSQTSPPGFSRMQSSPAVISVANVNAYGQVVTSYAKNPLPSPAADFERRSSALSASMDSAHQFATASQRKSSSATAVSAARKKGFEMVGDSIMSPTGDELDDGRMGLSVHLAQEQGLESQNFQCHGCTRPIGIVFGPAKVCTYDGRYYCYECHVDEECIIPAHVVQNWDLKKFRVCKANCEALHIMENEPVIDLAAANPSIYCHVPELSEALKLRSQLRSLQGYLSTCKDPKIWDEFRKKAWPREHLWECNEHIYSVQDLLSVQSGHLLQLLRKMVTFASKHVRDCELCKQKGFICEICHSRQVIYPFDLKLTFQCARCHAVFHRACKDAVPCPKCQRLAERHQSQQFDDSNQLDEGDEEF